MIEVNNRTRFRVDEEKVKHSAALFLRTYGCRKLDLSVALVGDKAMRRLNRAYRGQDRVTDVLSFPDPESLGEIVIDCAQIKRQASRYGRSFEEELLFMLGHGLLHLLGFDDKEEKDRQEMLRRGEAFLAKLKKLC